jgi:lipopolysaccharide/colanic/teichoic acid biosynthesis glycosyltransferase
MCSRESHGQVPTGRVHHQRVLLNPLQLGIKRVADVALSLAVVILGLPLCLLIALLIRLTSPGPIFFVQKRVGMDAVSFQMLKFRTMVGRASMEALHGWTQAEESRITPIGRFLRDYGLDELPQAINILRGDMSIVGPRPPLPPQIEGFSERERLAFKMRPGVLSLAAIKGRRSIALEQRRELHAQYVENWSLRLDLEILVGSLFVVLGRADASDQVAEPGSIDKNGG